MTHHSQAFSREGPESAPADQLRALERANVTDLKGAWLEVFGLPAPKSLHSGMVRRAIAYRLQADRHGDLPPRLQRMLREAAQAAADDGQKPAPASGLAPGSRLLRVWRGQAYEVFVTNDGFAWNGETFRSLTQLATRITGTHWNGPRFFGLREVARG